MEEVRRNSLEYLVEMNFLDQGYSTCMVALTEIEKIRQQLEPLVRMYTTLPFPERRNLMLAALLHDLRKPAKDHGPLMARELERVIEAMGLNLPQAEVARIAWLIEHHIDIRPLMKRMGEEGENALLEFTQKAGDADLVRSLILFTYADRVAVALDPNKASHDAMVLSSMLAVLSRAAPAPRRKPA
jgi:UTP:GlnB (protein PII) uridylyltransferase